VDEGAAVANAEADAVAKIALGRACANWTGFVVRERLQRETEAIHANGRKTQRR
jgi:hypothetical protein